MQSPQLRPSSPIIRLSPLPFSSLPAHPSLGTSTPRPHLPDFLHSVLSEAQTTIMPEIFPNGGDNNKLTTTTTIRSSPPSTAKVHLSTSTRRLRRRPGPTSDPSSSGKNKGFFSSSKRAKEKAVEGKNEKEEEEFWVCRQSVHEDALQAGTACWNEFISGLRRNHAENEMAYTPSVASMVRLLEWPAQQEIEGGWRGVQMEGQYCIALHYTSTCMYHYICAYIFKKDTYHSNYSILPLYFHHHHDTTIL